MTDVRVVGDGAPGDDDLELCDVEIVLLQRFDMSLPDGRRWSWSKNKAEELIAATEPRRLHLLSGDRLRQAFERNEYDLAYAMTTDCNRPGIAVIHDQDEPNGNLYFVLIDGTHRAAKAHRLDRVFAVYLLTPEEERLCRLPPL